MSSRVSFALGTRRLSADSVVVAAGYYAATTLSAVDADLVSANIKFGKWVFGIFGTYGGATLISCDDNSDSIYIHSGVTSTITTSFSSPSMGPNGLAYDGANLISSDYFVSSVYIHTGVTSTITTSFSSPGLFPTGLAYDGANLISCDLTNDSIYIHTGVTSTITTSFSSPSTTPRGLALYAP